MSKAILTLDDINLLINSEEPKNTELYGNLYEVLSEIRHIKAISLEQMPKLDKLARAAITINKRTLVETVTKEWYAERVSKEDPAKKIKCGLCNTPNKYLYYIRNRKNNKLLNVGSSCITKFPGLDGYIEQKKQLEQIQKGQKIVSRRNEFYNECPNCDKIISFAEEYFSKLPILLPLNLYTKLQVTITRMRLIYTKYVFEGKKPYKSELNSIELFKLAEKQINELIVQSDKFIEENIHEPLICKRREIDWMIENNKQALLEQIAEDKGKYSEVTLRGICSPKFIDENMKTFIDKKQSELFKIKRIEGNQIVLTFNKLGYQPAVVFKMSISNFMSQIGASCLFDKNYYFGNEEILKVADIYLSWNNIESIMNYISNMMSRFNSVFLFDNTTDTMFLFRKGDRSVRVFSPHKFLKIYSQYIIKSDSEISKFLFNLIKGSNSTKWMSVKEQEKQGIDEKINRLYSEYREYNMNGNAYNNEKKFEIITYRTGYDKVSNAPIVVFDSPEYISLLRQKINVGNTQLKMINYAIRISDDYFKPMYQKGDILLIQNTIDVKDNDIIFYVSDNDFYIKRCYVKENGNSNIFKHIHINKNKLQTYGKIVYCIKNNLFK